MPKIDESVSFDFYSEMEGNLACSQTMTTLSG